MKRPNKYEEIAKGFGVTDSDVLNLVKPTIAIVDISWGLTDKEWGNGTPASMVIRPYIKEVTELVEDTQAKVAQFEPTSINITLAKSVMVDQRQGLEALAIAKLSRDAYLGPATYDADKVATFVYELLYVEQSEAMRATKVPQTKRQNPAPDADGDVVLGKNYRDKVSFQGASVGSVNVNADVTGEQVGTKTTIRQFNH